MRKTIAFFILAISLPAGANPPVLHPDAEDMYERIGLTHTATQEQIDARIKEIKQLIAPDSLAGSPNKQNLMIYGARRIREAIGKLENRASRASYDRERAQTVASKARAENAVHLEMSLLPAKSGKFDPASMVKAEISWDDTARAGSMKYYLDASTLPAGTLPPALSHTRLTAEGPIALDEFHRIRALSPNAKVGIRSGTDTTYRREEVVTKPKFVVDFSSGEPTFLVRVNDGSGFTRSKQVSTAPPVVTDVKTQQYAYCPKGCEQPIPVSVLHFDADTIHAITPADLKNASTHQFQIGSFDRKHLVWIDQAEGYKTLASEEHPAIEWASSRLVELPRVGGDPANPEDKALVSLIQARESHALPVQRERTTKEACGDNLKFVAKLFTWPKKS